MFLFQCILISAMSEVSKDSIELTVAVEPNVGITGVFGTVETIQGSSK